MDWTFLILVAVAVFVTGISKGGFSGAFGIISVPLLSLHMSPVAAAAIMLPVICVMDLFTVQKFWNQWDTRILKAAIPASIVGIFIGSITSSWISADYLKVCLGLLAIFFAILAFPRSSKAKSPTEFSRASKFFWCSLTGFTSFIAHSGGPTLSIYLLRANLDKTKFVATAAVIFAVTNYIKILPYAVLGQFDLKTIAVSLAFVPVAYLGVYFGAWLHFRIKGDSFFKLMYALLLLTGIKLLWDGVS